MVSYDKVEIIPAILATLSDDIPDELEQRLIDRYIDGYEEYGVPLRANDPIHDDRDWVEEAKQELDDLVVYYFCAVLEGGEKSAKEIEAYMEKIFPLDAWKSL